MPFFTGSGSGPGAALACLDSMPGGNGWGWMLLKGEANLLMISFTVLKALLRSSSR